MADPAYDPFSQRRNTGTKDRVTERRRVDTYTDPNRYQMPPRRRLGVHASNKSMFVTPEKENITALAEGLSKVQPDIMGYIADRQIEANKKQIQYGIQEAMGVAAAEAGDTEFVDNEWRQFGYEQQQARMAGEDLGAELNAAVATKDPAQDYDEWYQNWWAEKNKENPGLATMNPEHMETFNKALMKDMQAAKNKDLVKREQVDYNNKLTSANQYVARLVREAEEENVRLDNELWKVIKKDQQLLSRWSNPEMDGMKFEAFTALAEQSNDLKYLDIFYENSGENDELPGLAYNPKYKDKIDNLRNKIVEQNKQDIKSTKAAEKTQAKEQTKLETGYKKQLNDELGFYEGLVGSLTYEEGQQATRQSLFYRQLYEAKVRQYKKSMPDAQAAEIAYSEALKEASVAGHTDELLIKLRKEYAAKQTSLSIEFAPLFDNGNKSTINTMEQIGAALNADPTYDIGAYLNNFNQLEYQQQENIRNRARTLYIKRVNEVKELDKAATTTLNTGVNTTTQGTENGTNTRKIGDGIKSL